MTSTQPADQSPDPILDHLRQQDRALQSEQIQSYWKHQASDLKNQFFQHQDDLHLQIGTLENAELQTFVDTLDTFKAALSDGCDNLAREIAALNQPIAFLNALSTVLSVVTQIVKPVV